jgi:hypothetical protein
MKIYKVRALSAVDRILELEDYPLYTQNADFYESECNKWKQRYNYAHQYPHQYPHHSTPVVMKTGHYGDSPEWLTVQEEITVMSHVRAFFQVAFKASYFGRIRQLEQPLMRLGLIAYY